MLKLEHISKTFNPGTVNEKKALSGLSLHLEPGDFVTIVGSNGAGKSTLFNAIADDARKTEAEEAGALDDIAAELGELMADTKQEEDDNDLISKEDER